MEARRALSRVLGGLVLAALWTGTALGDASTDLDWIGQLSGFSERSRGGGETSYLVSGDAQQAWDALAKGLSDRGWQVTAEKTNTLAALSARRMTAVKGNVEAFLHLKQAAVVQKLIVTRRTLDVPAAAGTSRSGAAPPRPEPAAPRAAPAKPAGTSIDLFDNGVTGTYHCEGSKVTVNGNAADITLDGSCQSLSVTGNGNRIRVDAGIESLSVLGNQNTVVWSRARNKTTPRIADYGSGNSVKAE